MATPDLHSMDQAARIRSSANQRANRFPPNGPGVATKIAKSEDTLAFLEALLQGGKMFDSAVAFHRYRLEVVKSWPDGQRKSQLIQSIESALRRNQGEREERKPATSKGAQLNEVRSSDY
jgi:hypothetical protein